MKSDGASLLHHDIRSALGDVLGGLSLIDAEALDPASRQQFDRVCASAEMLTALTAGALEDSAKTVSGDGAKQDDRDVRSGTTRLADVLDRLRRRWEGHAKARGGAFRIDIAGDLSVRMPVSADALQRILSNLVENAITHAALGCVTLSVQKSTDGMILFSVADEGPGFSDAALARLFRAGGRPGTDPDAGTGLGLHIARKLARELGGDIEVCNLSDRSGQITGARVSLELPVPRQRPAKPAKSIPRLSGLRVLVADDNDTSRALISQILRACGAECETVQNGADAYVRLCTEDFDLAVIDAQMPRLSGIDTIRSVRALDGARSHIPILVVTGMVLDDERMRLFDAGADTILAKPILSAEALGVTVREMLDDVGKLSPSAAGGATDIARNRCSWMDAQSAANANIPEPTHPAVWVDRAMSRGTRAGRLAHLVEIAGPVSQMEFIERLSSDLARCRATLATAFYERDLRVIRAQTHVLISLTGAIGAGALHDAVRAMNTASHKADWSALHNAMSEVWPDLEAVCEEVRATRIGLRAVEDPEVRPA